MAEPRRSCRRTSRAYDAASKTLASQSCGVGLVDNALLEPRAAACAEEQCYEFGLMVRPLVVPGGTGSPVNPIARRRRIVELGASSMSQVEIVPLEAVHLPGLLALVAGHLRMARYPFDAATEVLRQRAALALGSDGLFVERRRWMVSAAVDNGRLVGAVRAYAVDRDAAGLKAEEDRVPADIAWLLFEPDQPAAGAALLRAALSWIGDDPDGVEAFGLGHGMGWCGGVPDTWLHVNAIVGRAGFEWRETSYLMWGSGPPAISGDVNLEVQVTLDVTSDGTWQFWAQLDRVKVGELLVKRMDAPTGWQPTWSGGRWIDWVQVEEPLRRRGIAAAMFAALAERARRSGVRRLAASTRHAAAIRLNERIGMTNQLALRRYVFPSGEPKDK